MPINKAGKTTNGRNVVNPMTLRNPGCDPVILFYVLQLVIFLTEKDK